MLRASDSLNSTSCSALNHGQTITSSIAGARLIAMAIAYRGAGSIPQRRPIALIAGGGDDVAYDLHGILHGTDPVPGRCLGRGGTTSTTGLPHRVPRICLLVFCACSSKAR